ncbi:AMP-binding protein [Curtobacterium sp. A7_M15]|uniref:AMP-binding protein n=1 Tax=Curtobacterium sp. A7_M15 TaxID=3065241 RepID=UPI002737D6C5|nr:AMP-binding protein [Curtobacterium sp. A7_M15]MDP4331981.1 AMP-binding protein [Curtobacterium sp. A7_M15]
MRITISRAFTELAQRSPDAPAVRDGSDALTRGTLEARSNALARRYRDAGVRTDSFVTVVGGNTVDTVIATVAVWKAGATPQPLSPRLPAPERQKVLDLVDPALVVSDEPVAGRTWMPLDGAGDPASDTDARPLEDHAAASWKAPTSSGSTGTPKVVVAAASAHVDPDGRVAEFVPRHATQLVAGPLHHAAPFVYAMRGLMTGHALVLMPRFDAAAWLDTVVSARATWGMLVPTMMSRIMALGPELFADADVTSLDSVLHIGAVCPPHVKRSWIRWLGPDRVVEVYSGTESNGLAMIRGDEWLQHPGSVGRPIGGTTIRIVRPDGRAAGIGETGRIEMTRPGAATYRYLGRGVPAQDSWHSLGDSGHLDHDGYLYIADRNDDLIVSGGVNVWPAAVESTLERHPAVRTCVVVGKPDPDFGQRVHAVVDVGTSSVSREQLDDWAASAFTPDERPRSWTIVHAPIRDDTGKVRRRAWR